MVGLALEIVEADFVRARVGGGERGAVAGAGLPVAQERGEAGDFTRLLRGKISSLVRIVFQIEQLLMIDARIDNQLPALIAHGTHHVGEGQEDGIAHGLRATGPERREVVAFFRIAEKCVKCLLHLGQIVLDFAGNLPDQKAFLGAARHFVEQWQLVVAAGGKLPLNTNGGGLSYMHSGMYGMYALQESVRQMRGIAPAQVPGAKLSVCHGVGGMFAASGTIIMSNEQP